LFKAKSQRSKERTEALEPFAPRLLQLSQDRV
jgi:hypothetical protein